MCTVLPSARLPTSKQSIMLCSLPFQNLDETHKKNQSSLNGSSSLSAFGLGLATGGHTFATAGELTLGGGPACEEEVEGKAGTGIALLFLFFAAASQYSCHSAELGQNQKRKTNPTSLLHRVFWTLQGFQVFLGSFRHWKRRFALGGLLQQWHWLYHIQSIIRMQLSFRRVA